MGVSENLKRGVTELVVLAMLHQQDMYGYEIAQEMRIRSNDRFSLLETSMYPTLYRLQEHGYITSYEKLVGVRRRRTYYHMEPSGKQYFEKILMEYVTVQKGVQQILASCPIEIPT